MDFISKLDQEQQQNALKIADEAAKMGISPRLAVTLAYQESGLRHGRIGDAGEIGIMQIKPTTAEMLGFNRKQLDDADTNIKAGLTYLKQGLEKYKDPVLAVAGYNAGMDHPFFGDPKKELPKSTMGYLESIKGLGGFTEAPAEISAAAEAPSTQEPAAAPASEQDFQATKARALMDITGAGVGAVGAKALQAGQTIGQTGKAIRDLATAQAAKAAQEAQAATQAGKVIPSATGGLPPALGPDTRTPAGGRGTYNWAKAFGADELEARTATGMSEARQMQKQAELAKAKIGQIAPEMAPVAERGGLYLPQQTGAGPRGARTVPIPAVQPPAPPAPPGALQQAGAAAKGMAGAALRSPILTGALGGVGAAEGGMEAMGRMKQQDPIGAAIAGMGAAGSTMMMTPYPAAKIVGGVLGTASPLALYLYDKMRTTSPQAAQQMLMNVDLMGNPMP